MSSCFLLPSLFHRCKSLSETAHKPCTLGFYKHHFLIPLEYHLITCSCCTGARYGSALLDFCQSFSLQHVLSSSVALKKTTTKKTHQQQTHPPPNPNPLHTSLQTRSKSLILVKTYTLGFTVNLNAFNWENGTVEKYSKAPFSKFILILRLQNY